MNDKKLMLHIGVEAVVIAGLAFVTSRRNNELSARISQLEDVVVKQAEALSLMKRHLTSLETANTEKDKQMEMFVANVSNSFNVLQQEILTLKGKRVVEKEAFTEDSSVKASPTGASSVKASPVKASPKPLDVPLGTSPPKPLGVSPPKPLDTSPKPLGVSPSLNLRNNPMFPPVSIRIISQKTDVRKTAPKVEVISEEEDVDEKEIENELAELEETPLENVRSEARSGDVRSEEERASPLDKEMNRSPPPLQEIET